MEIRELLNNFSKGRNRSPDNVIDDLVELKEFIEIVIEAMGNGSGNSR